MGGDLQRRWQEINALPRLGWVEGSAPITALPELAAQLGLSWLGVKRDDLLPALHGSTKVRKLDYLLATPRLKQAERWSSGGAIGSGHLVALTAAAHELGHQLDAHLFWEPPDHAVLNNLAFIASGQTHLRYYESRVGFALRRPRVVLGGRRLREGASEIIAPGASEPPGSAGLVRAGLELALQISAGELPTPDRVVVPLGSGGTTAGLMLGLALAGLRPVVHAVAVVETPFSRAARILRMVAAARAWLVTQGVGGLGGDSTGLDRGSSGLGELPELRIDRKQVGPGYGVATAASLAAVDALAEHGLQLEAVYSGKAMASLFSGPPGKDRVLFWLTPHGESELPKHPSWREHLPWRLRRRLDTGRPVGRRAFVLGAVASSALALRVGWYPKLEGWRGTTLSARQAATLRASAEALLPSGPANDQVPINVDHYLKTLPEHMIDELGMAIIAVEQGSTLLGFGVARMRGLELSVRRAYFDELSLRGGMSSRLYRAVRDLCMVGYYQQASTWTELGYPGPMVGEEPRADSYDRLRAPAGASPLGYHPGPES